MADNVAITPGSGATIGMDEVVDGTLGTVKVGFGKIMDGTLDSTNKLIVNSSGEALTHPTANSQVDVNKIAGTTTDVNSGNKSAGTQRVVLATDQPALTSKLLVTPDLPSGASTAAKQPALGTAGSASADVLSVQGIASMTALKTDGSATTQPVSLATNTPTLQSGSTTAVTQATAANLNATVVGTGTFATQAAQSGTWNITNVSGAVSLPTGAATSANQTNGTQISNPSAAVSTGNITSTQAVVVSALIAQTVSINVAGTWTGTLQPQMSVDGTNFSNVGVIPFAPTGASVTTITTNGNYFVVVGGANKFQILGATVGSGTAVVTLNASAAGFGQLAVQSTAANLKMTNTTDQTSHGTSDLVAADITKIGGNAVTTTIPVSGTVTTTPPSNASTNVAQLAGTTTDTNSGNKSAGTMRVVLATDQPQLTNTLKVDGSAATQPVSAVVGSPVFVTPTPSTTGGWTPSLKNGLSNTNSQVKSGAGTLGGWYIYNPNATVAYVQIYDTATGSITVGTTTAKLSIGIPATSAANLDSAAGINFATAICVAATTTAGGSTAPGTALDCNFWYK